MGYGLPEKRVVVCGGFSGWIADVIGEVRWAGDCECGGGGGLDDCGVGGEREKGGGFSWGDPLGQESTGRDASKTFRCNEDTWDGLEAEGYDWATEPETEAVGA